MSEANIYVKCNNKSCKYLCGPFHDVEMANIAARLHEAAWFPASPFSQKHQAYFVNLEAMAERRPVPIMVGRNITDAEYHEYASNKPEVLQGSCKDCGMVESACECPSYDDKGNEL